LIAAKEKQFKWMLKTLIIDQQDNPEWRKVTLDDTCEIIVSPVDKKTVDGELPVKLCNYTDVYYNNTIDSKINFMAATAKPLEIEKFSLIEGDVIITKDSETPDDIGVPAYVRESICNLLCGYHLAILRPKKHTIGEYVCYALISPRVKYDFYRFANGITRFGLTMESYQKIKISLPLLPEQKRIVNLLDTTRKEVEVLKKLNEQYRTQKRGLMQKLLMGKWRLKTDWQDQRIN
ncbi:MAG: restriction endonuclease subunit S, partial [Candidatus Latescibacteria bacterium]|nr:restriction endonuclease subunit S [Candidatus Latescibacterota bacterium]